MSMTANDILLEDISEYFSGFNNITLYTADEIIEDFFNGYKQYNDDIFNKEYIISIIRLIYHEKFENY